VRTIADAVDLDFLDITQVGPDLRFTASLRPRSLHPASLRQKEA